MNAADKVCNELSVISKHLRNESWFVITYSKETKRAQEALFRFYCMLEPEKALESLPYKRWLELLEKEYKKL